MKLQKLLLASVILMQIGRLCAQTTQQFTLTNGDGWYRIIEKGGRASGKIKISGITGSNKSTSLTMFVSLMAYSQGGAINIVENSYYNGNHIKEIRGGSINTNGYKYVLDIYLEGINNPTNISIRTDGDVELLSAPIFEPSDVISGEISTSGKVFGTTSTRYPIYFSNKVGIGTDPSYKLHIKGTNEQRLYLEGGAWSGITIKDNTTTGGRGTRNQYLDGNNDGWQMYFGGHYVGQALRFAPVSGNITGSDVLSIYDNGGIGVGTGNSLPISKLDINGSAYLRASSGYDVYSEQLRIGRSDSNIRYHSIYSKHSDVTKENILEFKLHNGSSNSNYTEQESVMILNGEGNVGIGITDTKGYKLGVKGKIITEEVKVATYSNWSDFVFDKDYDLPTLKEVENHIKHKGHLENIPSANEVKKDGFFLGEMDSKLLQKIEELTLYTIQQEKQIEKQKIEIEKLKSVSTKLIELQKRLEKLEQK